MASESREPVPAAQGQRQQLQRGRLPHHGGRPLLLHGLLPSPPAGPAAHHPRRGARPAGHPGQHRGPDARRDGPGGRGSDPERSSPMPTGRAAVGARRVLSVVALLLGATGRVRPAPGGAQQGVGRGARSRPRAGSRRMLLKRVFGIGMVLGLAFILLVSLVGERRALGLRRPARPTPAGGTVARRSSRPSTSRARSP